LVGPQYYIAANVPVGASPADFKLMIQNLLIERLGMTVRWESKEQNVQELVVAQGGIKMKTAEPAPADATDIGPHLTWDKDGIPSLPPGYPRTFHLSASAGVFFLGRMQGIDGLIAELQNPIGQIIVDKTGLTGKYDYTLRFTFPALMPQTPVALAVADASGTAVADASPALPSLEKAIVEQLGLKLRPARTAVKMLVVDRFNKVPTEN
jgi:uncharacterized protein (TIGR03435 family)